MKMTYDKLANAAYIYLKGIKNKVTKTVEVTDNLIVDFGPRNKIVGFEILNASSSIGKDILRNLKKEKFNIPAVAIV